MDLACGFNSAHWSALFAQLTRINKLTIRGRALDTLRCFAEGPITQSLEELTINGGTLQPGEVSHLYALRRLCTVVLNHCFSARLGDATIDGLSPPTPLLPSLTSLRHVWRTADHNWEDRKRRGPSFVWMQARRTQ